MNEAANPFEVLAGYPLRVRAVERVTAGHINLTYKVEADEGVFTLQGLHPVFGPEVNLDIEAVTAHLAARGIETPHLLRTLEGELWTRSLDGRPWRVLTYVPGDVVLAAESPGRCGAAGHASGACTAPCGTWTTTSCIGGRESTTPHTTLPG